MCVLRFCIRACFSSDFNRSHLLYLSSTHALPTTHLENKDMFGWNREPKTASFKKCIIVHPTLEKQFYAPILLEK